MHRTGLGRDLTTGWKNRFRPLPLSALPSSPRQNRPPAHRHPFSALEFCNHTHTRYRDNFQTATWSRHRRDIFVLKWSLSHWRVRSLADAAWEGRLDLNTYNNGRKPPKTCCRKVQRHTAAELIRHPYMISRMIGFPWAYLWFSAYATNCGVVGLLQLWRQINVFPDTPRAQGK